jgi:exosortase A-associated hydrolase 1
MRRLTTFELDGSECGASLDAGDGAVGLLMVTGGTQSRIGSHRMYERLAKRLAHEGFSCFRFDRRGVGDSGGEDPGFRGSAPDLEAAAASFRREAPQVKRMFGFGLCDGATALALFADGLGLDGLILANPWLVEAEAGAPPAAAVRSHYKERLTSAAGWKKLLTGSVDIVKVAKALRRTAREDSSLAADVAAALTRHGLPVELILGTRDATAVAAMHAVRRPHYAGLAMEVQEIATDSHTFARAGDEEALFAAVLAPLRRLDF